jgi:hypothetical protein
VKLAIDVWYELWHEAGSRGLDTWHELPRKEEAGRDAFQPLPTPRNEGGSGLERGYNERGLEKGAEVTCEAGRARRRITCEAGRARRRRTFLRSTAVCSEVESHTVSTLTFVQEVLSEEKHALMVEVGQ